MKVPPTVVVFDVVKGIFPQGLRAYVDAQVYTLPIIVVMSPWIDSVANGTPPMSSNKTCLHPIKLSKSRIGWIAENLYHHVTPIL
ncbi:hypothetical protein ACTXT7_014617 [Hymenolepis weldensis]